MRAHDVRNLRECEACHRLDFKREFLDNERLCIQCAYESCAGVEEFMERFPKSEWTKLPLRLVGADGMRALLRAMETPEDDS